MPTLRSLVFPLTLCLIACAGEAFEPTNAASPGGAAGQSGAGGASQGGQAGSSQPNAGQGGSSAGGQAGAGQGGQGQAGASQAGSSGAGTGGASGEGQGGSGAGEAGSAGAQAGSLQAGSSQGGSAQGGSAQGGSAQGGGGQAGEGQAGQSLGGSGQGGSAAGAGGEAGAAGGPQCGPGAPCAGGGVCVEGACQPCTSSLECAVGEACMAGACVKACTPAHWLDVSGNGRHGKLVGVGGWEGDGSLGSAFALRLTPKGSPKGGSVLPESASSLLFSKQLTVEVWLYPDAQFSTGAVISARSGITSVSGYLLQLQGQSDGFTQPRWLGLTTADGLVWQPLPAQSGAHAGDLFHWKHLVLRVSFDDEGVGASSVGLFIDGVGQQNTELIGSKIAYAAGAQPRIGEPELPLIGTLGLVRMWPVPLTDDQIQVLFAQNAERFLTESKPTPSVDLPPPSLHYEATRCPEPG